ncbi:hypothetical protein N7504_003414 [Penicillium tannophilum]|nr:hypothetical protein N7504_003414 [Penicillium tannophilum]
MADNKFISWEEQKIFRPEAIEGRLNDDRIIYTSDKRILKVMRFMIALVAPGSLLIPVIALYGIRPQWARLFAIVSFTLLFSTLLTVLTRAKPSDIFAATAAYAAVMVVFVSNAPAATT